MNIGQAAELSGLSPKTIRYYEDIGLIGPARALNGYREYAVADTHKLIFIARARGLGFSIEECRILLSLYEDRRRASADVKAVASGHMLSIDRKIAELQSMRHTLAHLIESCEGNHRPDCPILDELTGGAAAN